MDRYKYWEKGWFARVPGKEGRSYPCYRSIICHALFNYYKKNDFNKPQADKALEDFISAYKSLESSESEFEKENFIYLYVVKMAQERGYLLVDKSGGYIPLLIYPDSRTSSDDGPSAPRKDAMSTVITIIESKKTEITDRFSTHNEWDENFQHELQELLKGI